MALLSFDGTENGGIELKSGAFESDVASNSKVATFESSVNSKVGLLSLPNLISAFRLLDEVHKSN